MTQCQYRIRWTFSGDAQCELEHHIDSVLIYNEQPDGRFSVATVGDGGPETHVHKARVGANGTVLSWNAGDRREYTGEFPGLCTGKIPGCTLPLGHHGNCAP